MKPEPYFLNQPSYFWAHVRSLSQTLGYTMRGQRIIRTYTFNEIKEGMERNNLSSKHLFDKKGKPNTFCENLIKYFHYRADILNLFVKHQLMDKYEAQNLFTKLKKELNPKCPLPMNKQKGEKRAEAFLTSIINMLIEKHAHNYQVDYDPRQLTTIVRNGIPLRTLARRVDGAFPSSLNPIAVWEIKEYYYTTTFGSRVADGIYETLLDGLELEDLRKEGINVLHYPFVDDYYTWWDCGKSYLCRLIDILNMGYIDEVVFGKEVMNKVPELVKVWIAELDKRDSKI